MIIHQYTYSRDTIANKDLFHFTPVNRIKCFRKIDKEETMLEDFFQHH